MKVPLRLWFVAVLVVAACDSRIVSDEGVWLGQRIGDAAEELRSSPDSVKVIEYVPAKGVDQTYSVGIGKSIWCPTPPCSENQGALTVAVEHGNHGSTTVHMRHVAVPSPLSVQKRGEPTHVVLRKRNGIIEVVELR